MAEDYQNLVSDYPRFRLATFPSPLERATRLEAALRDAGCVAVPRLYLKRDDVLSLGLGGNKIRNLEFQIGYALHHGATDIVTAGRSQSNHCRLTAAACARAGLRPHLVFAGHEPKTATGNQLLDRLLGAEMYFTGSDDREARAALVRNIAARIEREGRCPHIIPVGGSDVHGAIGHALAADELMRQAAAIAETLESIVLATATGGTQAGMLAGLRKLGVDVPMYGFAVARSASELSGDVLRLANEVAAAIGGPPVRAYDVRVSGEARGAGYGVPTEEAGAAIRLLATTEGVFADPVYTGKALAGLLGLIRKRRFAVDGALVFLHTGGAPALFAS